MPWDTKPEPAPQAPPVSAAPAPSALPPTPYANYDQPTPNTAANGTRIKTEPQPDNHYGGLPTPAYSHSSAPQGGSARAQYLLQQQYGNTANASISAMSQQPQQRGGLALPGQQQQAKPQGLQLPQQGQMSGQPQYSQQQQQAYQQQQHQRMQQQQAQTRIKVENESPQMQQGGFQQHPVNYTQTDGAGDDPAMEQWQSMLAGRRAAHAAEGQEADRLMRDQVSQMSDELESGLMVPLDDKKGRRQRRKRKTNMPVVSEASSSSAAPAIPQLDGVEDEDTKGTIKDEDDEDAINSDLDDSDEEGQGEMDNDDDDEGDSILCTYDKVQRVKNKWKCTLKDGVMSVNGKEWVFHKGTGEFEW